MASLLPRVLHRTFSATPSLGNRYFSTLGASFFPDSSRSTVEKTSEFAQNFYRNTEAYRDFKALSSPEQARILARIKKGDLQQEWGYTDERVFSSLVAAATNLKKNQGKGSIL